MIIEHLNCIGWEDDTAKQEEFLYNDIDSIIDKMIKHRDQQISGLNLDSEENQNQY